MKVKMILPALTEATSPFWRPIKYSLFPPLGLATLAGYLGDDDEVEIQDEHVETLDLDDDARPRRHSGLHHLRAPRLSDRGSLPRAAAPTWSLGGLHVTSLPDEAACRTPTRSSSALARTPGRGSSPTSGAGGRSASIDRRCARSPGFRRFGAI